MQGAYEPTRNPNRPPVGGDGSPQGFQQMQEKDDRPAVGDRSLQGFQHPGRSRQGVRRGRPSEVSAGSDMEDNNEGWQGLLVQQARLAQQVHDGQRQVSGSDGLEEGDDEGEEGSMQGLPSDQPPLDGWEEDSNNSSSSSFDATLDQMFSEDDNDGTGDDGGEGERGSGKGIFDPNNSQTTATESISGSQEYSQEDNSQGGEDSGSQQSDFHRTVTMRVPVTDASQFRALGPSGMSRVTCSLVGVAVAPCDQQSSSSASVNLASRLGGGRRIPAALQVLGRLVHAVFSGEGDPPPLLPPPGAPAVADGGGSNAGEGLPAPRQSKQR